MTTIKELFEKLPDDIRPKVENYLTLLSTMADAEAEKMFRYWIDGDYRAAYKLAVSKMTGAELFAAMEETNRRMKELAEKTVTQAAVRKQMLADILLGFYQLGKTALMMGLLE